MPYIKQDRRQEFDYRISELALRANSNGELTYIIFKLCKEYVYKNPINFDALFSDIIKCLECSKLEFYTQLLQLYENEKKEQNGEVVPILPMEYITKGD
jgi:hypothetical protein